jgi:glycerol kinase
VPGAQADAFAGNLIFGTIDTWLLWNLTEERVHATDFTNASRTMLYNIRDLRWDDELLAAFDIPKSMLPTVMDSSGVFGNARADILGVEGVPVCGYCGRPAGCLVRAGLFCRRNGKKHVRNRLFYADEYGDKWPWLPKTVC